MTNRDELCADLQKILERNSSNDTKVKEYIKTIGDNHALPVSKIFDYVTVREVISVLDDTMLFCICEAVANDKLPQFFNKEEIASYSKWKYVDTDKFTIPHTFQNVLAVGDDQWITITSAKELIRMGNSQVLRYNATTQRPLQIVRHGTIETYIPYYNKSAGDAIRESYTSGKYIPNFITINVPDTHICEYNAEEMSLRVDAPYFDLIDGYHRYRSLLSICSSDKTFDYPMGLQIMNFSEGKAKYFIYQEDQKTKMARSSSKAMDVYATQNRIVSRLNADPSFILCDNINQNTGVVNSADLGVAIARLYANGDIIEITNEIKAGIETLVQKKPGLLDKKWDKKYTYTIVFMIKYHIPMTKVDGVYKKVLSNNMFNGDTITRADTRKMNDILGKKGGV